jgi:arsenite methyltransferase
VRNGARRRAPAHHTGGWPRGRYGIDAPPVVLGLGIGGLGLLASGLALLAAGKRGLGYGQLGGAAFLLASTASFLHTTLYGKFVVWGRILDELGLRGDERILDLGCGRGACSWPRGG